jgi:hypothetical protein
MKCFEYLDFNNLNLSNEFHLRHLQVIALVFNLDWRQNGV